MLSKAYDLGSRQRLAVRWLPLAMRWASRYAARRRCVRGYREDLQSEAAFVLWECALAYDAARGPFPALLKKALIRRLGDVQSHCIARDGRELLDERIELAARAEACAAAVDEGRLELLTRALPAREAELVRLLVLGRMSLEAAGEAVGLSREGARLALRRALRRMQSWTLFTRAEVEEVE